MSGLFTFQYVSINTLDPSSTDNIQRVFTFQYVSINTRKRLGNLKNRGVDLHSNMFLLIHACIHPGCAEIRDLHSNMFLLIPSSFGVNICTISGFTFQYVSINTLQLHLILQIRFYLHSNMFLLIHQG